MRSTAGTVAALFLIGLVANCGGDDSGGSGPKGGSANASGEGGEGNNNTSGTATGGTSTAGKASSNGGEGGTPVTAECTKDADCGASAKCVNDVCKKNDGEACTADADCQNRCIDDVCSSLAPDGADCTSDDECSHTCIDGVCAPVSPAGGDCDVELGAGGAGGAGSGGAPGTAGAGGEAPGIPQAHDCQAPLQCVSGKCLTPDGEACTDNVDCVNTCVANVCEPLSGVDGACDDKSDCVEDTLVCDLNKKKCKLDLLSQCQANAQCQSNRCLCSDPTCSVRVCKTDDSVCQCRYSPTDSPSCSNASPVLNIKTKDPNGCDGAMMCSAGNCISDAGGACNEPCTFHPGNPDAMPAVPDSCTSAGAPVGCNGGYHGNVTSQCAVVKGTQTCTATCQCDLN